MSEDMNEYQEENLGWFKAVHEGTEPPENLKMLWFNTRTRQMMYYNFGMSRWESLARSQFYQNYSDLPEIGESGVLYVIMATGQGYIYEDNKYLCIFGSDIVKLRDGIADVIPSGQSIKVERDTQYIVMHRLVIIGHMVVEGRLIIYK